MPQPKLMSCTSSADRLSRTKRCRAVEARVEGPLIDDLDVAWNRCEVRYGVFRDYFSAHGFNQGREPVINERVKMVGPPGEHDERFARSFMPAPQCFARLTHCCAAVFERCVSGIDRLAHLLGKGPATRM